MASPSANGGSSAPTPGSNVASGGAGQFIGALISLISRSDIRYQGFLASIDAGQATIALERVRSWGTEGRLAQQGRHQEELPPNDNVYDYIVFRAADVKDLKIDDANPKKDGPPPPPQAFQDPAILGTGDPSRQYGPTYGGPPPPPGYPYGAPPAPFGGPGAPPTGHFVPPSTGFQGHPANRSAPIHAQPPSGQPSPLANEPKQTVPTSSTPPKQADKPLEKRPVSEKNEGAKHTDQDPVTEHLAKMNLAGAANVPASSKGKPASQPSQAKLPEVPHAAAAAARDNDKSLRSVPGSGGRQRGPRSVFDKPRGAAVPVPDADFDFDASNAKFSKSVAKGDDAPTSAEVTEAPASNVLDSIPPPPAETRSFYDKGSFFDSISNEASEREAGGRRRAERFAEEKRNMDTFGETGSSAGRGRGRGRGRGGRGRGRGGYRGRGGPQTATV